MQLILGPPGTGKTTHCLQEINHHINGSAPLYYLVPEQFSLQSERLLLSTRAAAVRVQVLSFNRLAYRLFAMLGGPPGKLADDLGKQMLLRKVLFESSEHLTYYKSAADKHGFVDSLAHTITEMNQYCISSTDLRLQAETSPKTLAAKLNDMALLLENYRETVKNRYLLTDDMLDLLCQKLDAPQSNPLLDASYFWVDGFSGFTPQERQVLAHIAKRAASLTITLTTRDRKNFTDPLSAPARETIEKLERLAEKKQIKMKPHIFFEKNHRHYASPELAHFVQHFSAAKPYTGQIEAYTQRSKDIQIIAAPDRYTCVYSAAATILHWVNVKGYRFRDIAILCGDRSHYEKILQTTFDRLNIPLFVDTETDILSHPLTELIRSALEIIVRNWSYESVFRFLKTRLTAMDQHTIDVLENYTLEHGINAYRWRYAFKDATAEDGRQQLLQSLENFCKPTTRADSKATIKDYARRIFDMLYALNIPETLQKWFDIHMASGDPATARLHKQIWPKCCAVFDKLVEILGDEKVSIKAFASILDAGFAQIGLGRIPPTTDQIILGDMGRSRYPEIKAMLVLGANENILPPIPSQSGLFTDRERQLLRNAELEIAPENFHRINENDYSLYTALSQPKEKLVFIYAENESGGNKPLRPSPILQKMRDLFPQLAVKQAFTFQEYGHVSSPQTRNDNLSHETTSRLYAQTLVTAASRLESFARCPFAYYMHYLLKARERKRFQVLPSDLGNLFHDILSGFAKQVWQNDNMPNDLERPQIAQIVDDLITTLTIDDNLYQQTARNRHILNKVQRTSVQSIWALCEHIKRGQFVPILTEHDIRATQGKITLTGRVDRIDMLTTPDGTEHIKIIDYKSGQTKFNIEEVRAGIQLQLMLYMNALIATNPDAKPGGVFYFPIGDPLLDTDVSLDNYLREEGLLKQFKMSGIAIADETTLEAFDKSLTAGKESAIIPVGINKDGRYKKSAEPMDLQNFKQLGKDVTAKINELGERMTSGDIAADPYTKGRYHPCQFCNFSAVCGKA